MQSRSIITSALLGLSLVACSDNGTIRQAPASNAAIGSDPGIQFDDSQQYVPIEYGDPASLIKPTISLDETAPTQISIGMVHLYQPNGTFSGSEKPAASAAFFAAPEDVTIQQVLDAFEPQVETCLVNTEFEGVKSTGANIDFISIDAKTMDIGEVILLSGPTGSYAELKRVDANGTLRYLPDGDLPGDIPKGLVVDVPGSVVPGYSGIAVPDVAGLAGIPSPAFAPNVKADSTFTWVADDSTASTINIEAVSGKTQVSCVAADDGSFTFPDDVKEQLGATFSTRDVTISRTAKVARKSGSSVLLLTNISGI